MEVEEWQDTQSSLPGSEEEEEEVVSFNFGGHFVPASSSVHQPPKALDKENEVQSHGIVSDKAAAAALPVAPPAVGSDHPAPSGTPLRSPLCRAEASSPGLMSALSPVTVGASSESGRTPLGPSRSTALNMPMASPEPSDRAPTTPGVVEERPIGGSASRRMSGGAPVWSPRLPTAAAATPGKSVEVDGVGSAAGLAEPPAGGQEESKVKEIVEAIEARTSIQLQRRLSREQSGGSTDGEAVEGSAEEDSSALRRLSAGLSLRYEPSGEHCPKYSQRELDLILNKRLDDLRAAYEEKLRATEEQVMEARQAVELEKQEHLRFQLEIDHQLEQMEADFERRDREQAGELQNKEIQLKAVTAQFAEMQIKVERMEQEVAEARRKLEEAATLEARLNKEWADKMEAEKARRKKDVQAMKENVTNRAKEQFEAANQQYWQLDADYRNAKEEVTKLATEYNKKQTELSEALRLKDKALSQVSSLEQQVASLQAALTSKDEELLRVNQSMELRIQELTAKVEKEAEGKRLAVADREMAMESLSRSAVHLTEYKNRAEEQSLARERAMGELAEHKQMCEELLAMVEGLQNKVAALEATQQSQS